MAIYKMRPLLVPRIWGGERLPHTFGGTFDQPIGEAWLVADLPEGTTFSTEGQSLSEIVADTPGLTGAFGPRFPLLVKVIDAEDDLSVQVHPGAEDAARFEGARSKDESWLVLEARPGASIYLGFRRACTTEEFREALGDGRVTDLLEKVEVAAGDVFRIAPGTVHAIGAGVTLLEVQEPSDTTFRVYDYNRPGLDGKPRTLHVEEALQVARLDVAPRAKSRSVGSWELLAAGEHYAMLSRRVDAEVGVAAQDGPVCLFVVDGQVEAHVLEESKVLGRWETAVIPAGCPLILRGNAHVVLATTRVPQDL